MRKKPYNEIDQVSTIHTSRAIENDPDADITRDDDDKDDEEASDY